MADDGDIKILKLLEEKLQLKEEVFNKTKSVFADIKSYLNQLIIDLKSSVTELDKKAPLYIEDSDQFEFQFTMCDETLLFIMHTNVFTFDNNHEIWRNKYVQLDSKRAYCGKIFIYNFLSDSFKYNRLNDVGYLLARIFVNKEGHFFIEGQKKLGYPYTE